MSKEVYDEFTRFVENRHGTTRGTLGVELDNAVRAYMSAERGGDQLTRIENDLATVKALVADAEADGGTPTRTVPEADGTHTHRDEPTTGTTTPDEPQVDPNDPNERHANDTPFEDAPDEPPHPKASRRSKAEWVAARVESERDPDGQILVDHDLAEPLDDAYSFEPDTINEIANLAGRLLVDESVLEPHPFNESILVSEREAERRRQKAQADAEAEAADESEDLDAAEQGDPLE
ncbi:hypothetical protein HrrHc1_265 [Halorubrum phage Hardycor1]|nr:hypothetical protein HrrHc1_265 [Halorubrum phage Hardycor1]